VSKIASAQQTNVRKRATYIYNMLPQSVIKQIEKDGVKITITSVFSNTTMEDGGYSGYWRGPNEIYLKEKDNYRLEYSLLHEIGHYLTYYKITGDANGIAGYFYNSCYSEADLLGLKEYYTSEKDEYAAEAFKYYVLNPKKLKKEAENTYNFIEKEILGISD
jgi:hypothetical protein